MLKKRIGSLLLSAALAAGLLHGTAGPAVALEPEEPAIPAAFQDVMEEEGFTGLSTDLAEDLNSVVFENPDGSRTLYMYDQPVKYRDEGGVVCFKTQKAKKTDKKQDDGRSVYAYENQDNDLKTYLPARIEDGVLLEKDGYRLEIFPETAKNSRARLTGGEAAAAVYANALPKTDFILSYTLDGVQLQMELEQYAGQNEFQFTVDPHGLIPQQLESHVIVFQDPQTGEAVCTLNTMELRSANYEQTGSYTDISYTNSYRLTQAEDGRYAVTAVLDEEFLTNPSTAYPLSVVTDTVWRYDTKDTTVFEGDSGNYHTAAYDYVGYYPAGRNRLRAMKLAQMDTSVLKFINPIDITNAYYCTQVSGAADSWTLETVRPAVLWDADTVTYADVENQHSLLYNMTLSNTTLTTLKIPITFAVMSWIEVELGESTALDSRQGIMLMPGVNCPTTSYRTFYSANYSVAASRPAFVVEYIPDTSIKSGLYFIRNAGCERYLDAVNGGTAAGTGTCIYDLHGRSNQLWYINLSNSSTGQYTIRPYYASSMYLSAKDAYASPLALSSGPCYWRLLKNGDGSYRIMVDGSERQAAESAGGSVENSTAVKTWGYGGAPNQKWIFEKATQLGCAGAYRQVDSTGVNCFGYALGLNKAVNPGYASNLDGEYLLDVYYSYHIEPKILKEGLHVRRLTDNSAYLRPNEHKIVFRCGEHDIPKYNNNAKRETHFMTQISTGAWAEKMGVLPSENLGYINPSTYSWDFIKPNASGTSSENLYHNFYDSSPIYLAIWQ